MMREGRGGAQGERGTHPEVGDLDLSLGVDEEVLGLDVAVDDVLVMAVEQRSRQRADVVCRPL